MWFEQFNTVYMNEAGADGESGGGAQAEPQSVDSGSAGGDSGQSDSNADANAVADAIGDKGNAESSGWFFADGVAGEGEAPEWFKGGKYKSVSEQAKAYTELESRFGSFTGAPEEYSVNLGEELSERGVSIDSDDPMLEEAMKFAKDANMDQKGFDNMVNLYAMMKVAESDAIQQAKQEEIKSLGSDAQKRLDNLNAWGNANMPPELFEGFQSMVQSAGSVKALERLVAMTRNAPVNPDSVSQAPSVSSEEVMKMQFEKDEHGNRRIQTDPAFKQRYEQMRDQVWGGEEHRVIIG